MNVLKRLMNVLKRKPEAYCIKCGGKIFSRNIPFVCPHCGAQGTLYPSFKEN